MSRALKISLPHYTLQVPRKEGDMLIKISPADSVSKLKKDVFQKQIDFRSPHAVRMDCQALFLLKSKDPRMDRLVGYELDDRMLMSEYGLHGKGTFNAASGNVEEIAAVLLLVDHSKLPHAQHQRYLNGHRANSQCFQS